MNHVIVICGDSASGKTKLAKKLADNFEECLLLECDRYHKWERNNYQWKYFTHLNPYANNLELMINDLNELEKNNKIIRHDYDHATGKFTEEKEIIPRKYIIACGLHTSLFNPQNGIKIYIDTDHDLKIIWKIQRDFQERGYKTDDIIKKINERQNDFKNYIEPQKKKCDLIVKFSLDEKKEIINQIFSNQKKSYSNEFIILNEYKYENITKAIEKFLKNKNN